mgnify:CR=1 FL=1
MTDDLTSDLDLLGDWLDAKGYGEEAGLCTRVMDYMHKQDARIAALKAALAKVGYDFSLSRDELAIIAREELR